MLLLLVPNRYVFLGGGSRRRRVGVRRINWFEEDLVLMLNA